MRLRRLKKTLGRPTPRHRAADADWLFAHRPRRSLPRDRARHQGHQPAVSVPGQTVRMHERRAILGELLLHELERAAGVGQRPPGDAARFRRGADAVGGKAIVLLHRNARRMPDAVLCQEEKHANKTEILLRAGQAHAGGPVNKARETAERLLRPAMRRHGELLAHRQPCRSARRLAIVELRMDAR